MASYNRVILMGNLTRDPQLRYLPSQMAVAEFGLAMNRRYRTANGEDREETTFVDCSAFGKTGELINQYFTKGRPIFIEGRLKYDQWEDKQGGGKRSRLTVVVDNFQFVGPREGSGSAGGYSEDPSQSSASPRPQNRSSQRSSPPPQPDPFPEEQQFKDDDIPF